MPQAKSKNKVGLGNTLMNDRFGRGSGSDRKKAAAVVRTNHATGEEYLVNDRPDAAWVKMKSVTEQSALDEFLATAELAGTDFTAEKMSKVKIIQMDQANPYLLSTADERNMLRKHADNVNKLTVPRRPKWDDKTTPQQLEKAEMQMFYDWRKVLRDLAEDSDLLLTPFERNLEVWRQLWRVIERSDLVVQIVDARNPVFFRSEDLVAYVQEVDPKKQNLLLINKADMMTIAQRQAWASYLIEAGIAYRFFSANLAQQSNELRDREEEDNQDGEWPQPEEKGKSVAEDSDEDEDEEVESSAKSVEHEDDDTRILTVEELEEILLEYAPENPEPDKKFTVGLVGYPNVGKSSTINALVGAKKVSVSATPGKTKHFQTIHLSDDILLCDCPGLVFPNFATTRADLVCNGVLPIDECREYLGPIGLVALRMPRPWLEALYGFKIRTRPVEEGGTGSVTATELLVSYAKAKGIIAKYGRPDEGRAARQILKDYVNGKLLWCHPPPGADDDGTEFNRELYDIENLPDEKKKATLAKDLAALSAADDEASSVATEALAKPASAKSESIDRGFFGPGGSNATMKMPFNFRYSEQGQAKALSGRKARTMVALEKGLDSQDVVMGSGKKHFKAGPKGGKGKKHGVRTNPYGIEDA